VSSYRIYGAFCFPNNNSVLIWNVFGHVDAGEGMLWMVHDIENLEMEIRLRGCKAMQRPAEIHAFLTMVKRII
jgi:hypothetical protein